MRWKVPTHGEDESYNTFDICINNVDPEFMSLAEMASLPVPDTRPADGISVLPSLKGEKMTVDHDNRTMFFHFHTLMVRSPHFLFMEEERKITGGQFQALP